MVKELKDFIIGNGGYCKYLLYIEKPEKLSLHSLKVAKLRHFLWGLSPCTQNCTSSFVFRLIVQCLCPKYS